MTTHRGKHDKDNPFTRISNMIIDDKRLSAKARLLIIYVLRQPDGWQTNPTVIKNSLGYSNPVYWTCLNEAEEYGYLKRVKVRNQRGHVVTYQHWYEESQPTEASNPNHGIQATDSTPREARRLITTDLPTTEVTTEGVTISLPSEALSGASRGLRPLTAAGAAGSQSQEDHRARGPVVPQPAPSGIPEGSQRASEISQGTDEPPRYTSREDLMNRLRYGYR